MNLKTIFASSIIAISSLSIPADEVKAHKDCYKQSLGIGWTEICKPHIHKPKIPIQPEIPVPRPDRWFKVKVKICNDGDIPLFYTIKEDSSGQHRVAPGKCWNHTVNRGWQGGKRQQWVTVNYHDSNRHTRKRVGHRETYTFKWSYNSWFLENTTPGIEKLVFDHGNVYFRNNCSAPVKLLMRYKQQNGQWTTDGWWTFNPGKGSYLASNGKRIVTANSIFYYYAITSDKRTNWKGDYDKTFNGKDYPMRKKKLSKNSDGDWRLSVKCSSRN